MEFLFRLFIKDYNNTKSPAVRKRYGLFGSICGIISNLALFLAKFLVGNISGSVAVTADAFNNLSDMGSSIVTLLGFTLSSKPSDNDHPFGHGRIEYVSSLFVSFLIVFMGFSFVKDSVHKIIYPTAVSFNLTMILTLVLTIPIKLWLSHVTANIGKKIGSGAMAATSHDSLNDVLATSGTVLAGVLTLVTSIPFDGYIGLVISLFVLYSGISIAKDTLSPLLGQAPGPELTGELLKRIMKAEDIIGTHDLILHNYGPGRYIASVHAEVPSDISLIKIHDIVDNIEREIYNEMGIIIAIHIDPIEINDEKTNEARQMVLNVLSSIHPQLGMHDFRIVVGQTHENLVFDVTVPDRVKMSDEQLKEEIDARIKLINNKFNTIIIFDKTYI